MKLRVNVTCADCGETKEVHILGGWDIKRVLHQCARDIGHQSHAGREMEPGEFEPGEFAVIFEPPRRAF